MARIKQFAAIGKTAYHVFIFIAGTAILLVVVPHVSNWQMVNLSSIKNPFPQFAVLIPFAGITLNVRPIMLALFFGAIVGIFYAGCKPLRNGIMALKKNRAALFAAIISAIVFAGTLIPRTAGSRWIVIYLMCGACGMCMIIAGSAPGMRYIARIRAVDLAARTIFRALWRFVFDSKALIYISLLALAVFALTNVISLVVFEHIPHIPDSIAQFFQAKIFAGGHCYAPSPIHREFFDYAHIINNGKWYSQYPPGHSFLLMMGMLLHAPWLINPLLGAFTIVALYFCGKELYSKTVGRFAALLGVCSPFLLFMCSEYMNHASALVCFALFLAFFSRCRRSYRIIDGLGAGLALGFLCLVRPYTALALAIPFILYGGFIVFRNFRRYWRPMAALCGATLTCVCILFGYNYVTNGSAFLFGYEKLYGPEHLPGFGHHALDQPPLTPALGLTYTLDNLNALQKYLFEWPVPSLIFVLVLFATATKSTWDRLLLISCGSLSAAYFIYWFHDWCFGPRFLYEATVAYILLTSRGVQVLPAYVNSVLGFCVPRKKVLAIVASVLVCFSAIGFYGNVIPLLKTYGADYWGVNAAAVNAVKKSGINNAIVFTQSNYGSVFFANSPWLDTDIIYARDKGEQNKLLLDDYPSRNAYYVNDAYLSRFKAAR
jgi:hypothetical protein